MARSPSSQPPDSPCLDTGLADASKISQSEGTSASTSPQAPDSPPDHVRLPNYHPITPPHFHWGRGFQPLFGRHLSGDCSLEEE